MVARPCLNENRGKDIVTSVDIVNQILQEIALIGSRFWPVFPRMVMGSQIGSSGSKVGSIVCASQSFPCKAIVMPPTHYFAAQYSTLP